MIFLFLSIACSTIIMLTFKAFETYRVDNFQAIVFNYLTCSCIGLMTIENDVLSGNVLQQPWFPFAILLGCIFIATFNLIALTTQRNGVTVATIASKTTMVIPVTLAFFLYGDAVTFSKIAGIGLAIAAIFLTALKDKQELADIHSLQTDSEESVEVKEGTRSAYAYLLLPLSVFFAGGFIEVVINYVQVYYLETDSSANTFTMFLFTTAGLIGLAILIFQALTKGKTLTLRNLLGGIALGIPNYGSIYCLIMALNSTGMESSQVFPLNNIGIVVLTSFLAFLIFRERLTKMNILGVLCAITAIFLITFS